MAEPPVRPRCRRVVVAVPARDEAATVAECLASIDAAAALVDVPVLVSLAADSCTDDTVVRALAAPLEQCRLVVVEGTWGRAGAARSAAVAAGLGVGASAGCWIANTDADCRVPPDWLAVHLQSARAVDAVAGIVTLNPATTASGLLRAFHRSYRLDGHGHGHVHGANLGVWADAYQAAGGWSTSAVVGEDHALWNALRRGGSPVAQIVASSVVTSERLRSRVDGGFATDLSRLVTNVGPAAAEVAA